MLLTLFLVLFGIVLGICLRRTSLPQALEHWIMPVVWVLLFLLGLRIGGDPLLMAELPRIGLLSLLFTLVGIAGSLLGLRLFWRWLAPVLPARSGKMGKPPKSGDSAKSASAIIDRKGQEG